MDEQTTPDTEETPSTMFALWRNYIWPLTLSLAVAAVLYLILPLIEEGALLNIGRSFLILIGGILPSIMYRYFTQERLPTFYHEYKQNLRRLGLPQNAKQYQEKFEAVYGPTTQSGQIAPFNSPVFITTLLAFIGWSLVFFPIHPTITTFIPNPSPFAYGFLGAYIFGVSSLVRQFVTDDLQPRYYASLTIRFVTVFVLSWMVYLITPGDPTDGNALLVAFFIGLFPATGLRVIQRIVTKMLGIVSEGFDEGLPLSELDGLNAYHEDRLLIEGIENVQNLASANIIDLMLRTRFPVEQVIDWMDQALLKIHARDRFEDFRRSSLRTATDFIDAYEATDLEDDDGNLTDWRQRLAGLLDSDSTVNGANTATLIDTMYYALQRDPNLFQIRYWRDHEFEALPEDIEYERTKADLKLMQNLPNEAIPIYDRLIQKFEGSYILYLYRGLAHAANGDYLKAINDYEQVINSSRMNPDTKRQAYLYRFRAHLELVQRDDKYSETIARFQEEFGKNLKDFPEAQMDLAVAQLTYLGQYREAIGNLTAVIESNFNVAEAYANRGLAHYQLTRTEPMEEHQKHEELQLARADLEYALQLKPSLIAFYINLAIILGEWGELEEKERVLTAALAQLQVNPDDDYAYRVRLERGYLYSKQERYEEAAQDFETATRLSPAQPTAYFFYGTVLRKLNRLAEAAAVFQRATVLDPELDEAYEKLGDVLLLLGDYEQAERAYATALQLARETADKSAETRAHMGLGQVYHRLQRLVDAERELKAAINLAGDDEAELFAHAEFELGLVKLEMGDQEAAIVQFANSAVLFEVYGDARASANAYYHLGQTQIETEQYDEAREALQTARQRLNTVFVPDNNEDQALQEKLQQGLERLSTLNGQPQSTTEPQTTTE